MTGRDITTGKVALGLLADSMNVFVGWPTRHSVVPPVDGGEKKTKTDPLRSIRTQLAFLLCVCTGSLQ
jgi:hypothetical protein